MTGAETFIDAAIWHGGLDRANALWALLAAGASTAGVPIPCGYDDALLKR